MVGSDQMAIQRYLATRDAVAARRALFTTACTELTVQPLLVLCGLALLGFFLANPHLMPQGKDIVANADHALPFFIMNYLPAGIAGLVVSLVTCIAAGVLLSMLPVQGMSRAAKWACGVVVAMPLVTLLVWVFCFMRIATPPT